MQIYLLHNIVQKKLKRLAKIPNGVAHEKSGDPFGDDEDDIARIAREMEAKYVSVKIQYFAVSKRCVRVAAAAS
jgi:hypothetical protein